MLSDWRRLRPTEDLYLLSRRAFGFQKAVYNTIVIHPIAGRLFKLGSETS